MSFRTAALAAALLLQQLPAPFQTPWFRRPTTIVEMPEGRTLTVPAGFHVNVFADKLQFARFMAVAPNGDVFLAEPVRGAGVITVLRDADGDGVAEFRATFATGLNRPFGLAFWKDYLYVGNNDSVIRFAYRPGQTRAEGAPEKIADLPPSDAALDQDTANRLHIDLNQTRGYNHWTRNVIFNPAGTKLYVTVGSSTNATPEPDDRRAAINEYNPDGSGHRLFATGLRNPVGLAYFPGTGTLWTAVNERDHLGDDLVPDFITSVRDGGFYGWPYSYIGKHLDPTVHPQRADLVERAITPSVLLPSHAAALGLLFYTGSQFPADYRQSAFVALHGSINRSTLSGYSVVRVPFRNGEAAGPPENFLTGFVVRDDEEKSAWGRPVGLAQLADGSILVSDDAGNRVWRVSYRGAHH
ncbi:MAG TPA: sorbosone dehydrogenase family protein [Vicinamibacterales bacterium]|nr:sorbosone dehydrogenase family protein [Vicinamibacterales bacterium]